MCDECAVAQVAKKGAEEAHKSRPASPLVSKSFSCNSKRENIFLTKLG